MQLAPRLLAPFFRLQWKLTLAYTITTMLVLLSIFVVGIIIALAGLTSGNMNLPQFLEQTVQTKASQAAPLFRGGRPDRAALTSCSADRVHKLLLRSSPITVSLLFWIKMGRS